MKKRNLTWFLLIFILGCGPYIWFKVPQPENAENLIKFPGFLCGSYTSVNDSSIIKIDSFSVIREYHENLILSKIEFRNEVGDTISEDTSFIFADNWKIIIESYNDSVKIYSSKDETVFHISNDNLLRNYRNYYFLNFKDPGEFWRVKILKLEKDTLEFDNILSEDDIKLIKNMKSVEIKKDSINEETQYYLKPSKRELKKILKYRSSGEKFIKL